MLARTESQVKLSCQIMSRTFLLIRKTFPSSRTCPQKPLAEEDFTVDEESEAVSVVQAPVGRVGVRA